MLFLHPKFNNYKSIELLSQMCKIKEYTNAMHSNLTSVLLRFDTYFLYDEYSKHAAILNEWFGGTPSEILFDEISNQLLDVDSIAELHDTFLNTVMSSKLIRIKSARLDDIECDIYINPYFVAFDIIINGKSIEELINIIREAYIKKTEINLLFCYFRLIYSVCKVSQDLIWEICDRSAFPIMEEGGYSGQYTDSTEKEDVSIDLSRLISPSDKESSLTDIIIQSKAICPVSNMKEATEVMDKLILLSKNEISRCFKK